jgi:hypothetical protein
MGKVKSVFLRALPLLKELVAVVARQVLEEKHKALYSLWG